MHAIDAIILGKLYDRPCWAKSFYKIKSRLTLLVNSGFIERIAPPNNALNSNRGRNMVTLTPAGIDLIEHHWSAQAGSHPS